MSGEIQKHTGDMPLAQMGGVFARSGFFADAKEEAQAIVKIQAGRELGIAPVASMTGIYIVKGRVTLSANVMAAVIRMSKRYDFRVLKHTDQECGIEFRLTNGEVLGQSSFSMADAKRAGLERGDNWKSYPKNMLFARALSNGAKWYCPDIFSGGAYTPDELGAQIGAEGQVIDVEPVASPATSAQTESPAAPAHPVDQALAEVGDQIEHAGQQAQPSAPQVNLTKLQDLIDKHGIPAEKVRAWCQHFKVDDLQHLSQEQVDAIVERVTKALAPKGA